MSKIELIKHIDRVFGRYLVSVLSKIKRAKDIPTPIKKILVIRPGGIGDAVLLLPSLVALKQALPGTQIDILCEKRNADIFTLSRETSTVYLYDKNAGLLKCLRNRYDVVIDTEQWHRLSAAIAFITGAAIRIGFATNERAELFTDRISYSHDDYEVFSFFNLLAPLIGNNHEFNPEKPFIGAGNYPLPESLAALTGGNDKFIAIFPGASVRERRWGGERFGKVAKALHEKGYKILILGSSSDRGDAEIIRKQASGCIDLTGRTTLRDVAMLLKLSRLLITSDSGIMHIAYAVGTPSVSLFGPGMKKKWAPRSKKHTAINKHLPCSPCTKFGYTPRCTNHVECLSAISADEVLCAADMALTTQSAEDAKL